LSYDDIKRAILHCDESVLSDSVLQQLIQYMPTPEQLKKLEEYKEQYDSLAEAEQFSVTVIHRPPRTAFSPTFSQVFVS
jgi:diaphanous 2